MKPIVDSKPVTRSFRIVDTIPIDKRFPYTLLDESGNVLRLGARLSELSALAFDQGATDVNHAYEFKGL